MTNTWKVLMGAALILATIAGTAASSYAGPHYSAAGPCSVVNTFNCDTSGGN